MHAITERLTQHERDSLRRVHQAIRNDVQTSTLLSIRNEIFLNSDKQFGFIEAFDDILKVNKVSELGSNDEAWACLTKTAERYHAEQARTNSRRDKEWCKWKTRVRHTLFISMQWSSETLTRYGWDTEKFRRDGLSYAYSCAMKCPSFEVDFIPQANLVHWLKHCSAVSALEASKEHDFAPYGEEIAVKDLHSLSKLTKGEPVLIYGKEVTLETAGQLQHEIRRWTENQNGMVFVGGKWLDLKEHRPTHWNIYLLKFNDNGLLVRRKISDRAATPCRDGILSPPTSMLAPADQARIQLRSSSSVIPVSTNGAPSIENSVSDSTSGSVAGSVAGKAVASSADVSTAGSAAEIAAASATCSATTPVQHDLDLNDTDDTPKTRYSDAGSTCSHGAITSGEKGSPVASHETEPSRLDSACEASCVRRSARARARLMEVRQVFSNDDTDGYDQDHSSSQGPSGKPLNEEPAQDKDSDFESSSNRVWDDLSRAHDKTKQTPTSTDGMGKEQLDVQQESTQDPTQASDIPIHKAATENGVIAEHEGDTEASFNVLPGQTEVSRIPESGKLIADLSEVESWLMDQDSSLFVGNSPSDVGHRRSEAPEGSPLASRVSRENDAVSEDGALPIDGVWTSANNKDKDVSADSGADIVTFLPPATREMPNTSRVRTVSPQPVATQDVKTKSSVTSDENFSDTTDSSFTSESSSELASLPNPTNGNVVRTVQGLTPTSSERSSSSDSLSPSGASLSNSDAREAWPGCNARDLSSPLKFAKVGHYPYGDLSIASDALTRMPSGKKVASYLSQMPPSVFAPYIPHASIEGKGSQEGWGKGYASLVSGLRGRLNDDDECSDDSDGTLQDPRDPPSTHFGPRPQDCGCDDCEDIGPLLERIRTEASANEASRSCRARDRWFGSAKWASAAEVFDMGEGGQQTDHEVIYVDQTSFREMAEGRVPLDRPIVIKGYQHGQDDSVEAFQKVLKDSYGDTMVTMTDALADSPTGVGMGEFLTRFSTGEWSIGSSTPRGSFGTQPPAFLSYNRFRLLQSAVTRASCQPEDTNDVGVGCNIVAHSLCVNGGLSFNRIESSGAFSGPCLGSLGGTWLHVLQGRRLCAFIPRERLTTSFRDGFVRNGLEWRPQDEQRLVLLGPDDILVLPADIVCAQLAVDAGVSFEGSFWDESDWGRYFTAAQWAAVNPTHVTAQIPRCATRLALHGLKSIAKDDPQRFASDPFAQEFLETDRSGIFEKVVMAGRCSPGRTTEDCGTQRLEGLYALGTAGNRRMSDAEADNDGQQRAKRMCIR